MLALLTESGVGRKMALPRRATLRRSGEKRMPVAVKTGGGRG